MSTESIERTLGRLEAKVDALLASQEQSESRANSHSKRIGKLENWRSGLTYAYAVLVLLLGAFLKLKE